MAQAQLKDNGGTVKHGRRSKASRIDSNQSIAFAMHPYLHVIP
jgi:hypothetical protein